MPVGRGAGTSATPSLPSETEQGEPPGEIRSSLDREHHPVHIVQERRLYTWGSNAARPGTRPQVPSGLLAGAAAGGPACSQLRVLHGHSTAALQTPFSPGAPLDPSHGCVLSQTPCPCEDSRQSKMGGLSSQVTRLSLRAQTRSLQLLHWDTARSCGST